MENIKYDEFVSVVNNIEEYDNETNESIELLNQIIIKLKDTNIPKHENIQILNNDTKYEDRFSKNTFNELGLPINKNKISEYKGVSCIYLICLGYISEIRNIYNVDQSYPDDSILCKYGLTKNLDRRLKEHKKDYGNILKKDIYLKFYVKISENILYFAENILEDIFIKLGHKYNDIPRKTELVIIPKKELEMIKNEYDKIKIYLLQYDVLEI